jgi:predicted amidohydrolase
MSYVIGVNRVGEDYNGYQYTGHSQLVDYLGEYLIEPKEAEGILLATLDKAKMIEVRKRLDFLSDKDFFEIKN